MGFRFLQKLALVLALSLACGCAVLSAPEPATNFGVAPGHVGYVPARIAIMPCQPWPNGARFQDLPLTNAAAKDVDLLCAKVDAAVLKAFSNQPYMRGYSPKVVERELARSGEKLLARLPELFAHGPDSCFACGDVPTFYTRTIAARTTWLKWLTSVGKAVKNADAALFPFLSYAYSKRYSDRGLKVAERAAGVVLLLVDTETGSLIWAGGREALAPNRRLEADRPIDPARDLAPPPWEDVTSRLLTEDLWRDFPGRQIY